MRHSPKEVTAQYRSNYANKWLHRKSKSVLNEGAKATVRKTSVAEMEPGWCLDKPHHLPISNSKPLCGKKQQALPSALSSKIWPFLPANIHLCKAWLLGLSNLYSSLHRMKRSGFDIFLASSWPCIMQRVHYRLDWEATTLLNSKLGSWFLHSE